MSAQGGGVAGMDEYDVAHIDLDQYRQLRALVLSGRAKARIVVETLDAPLIVGNKPFTHQPPERNPLDHL